jgi:hypothetical protein
MYNYAMDFQLSPDAAAAVRDASAIREMTPKDFAHFLKGADVRNRSLYTALRSPDLTVAEAKAIESVLKLPPAENETPEISGQLPLEMLRGLRQRGMKASR